MENFLYISKKFINKIIPSFFIISVSSYATYQYGSSYFSTLISEYEFQKTEKLKEMQRKKDIQNCIDSILDQSHFNEYKNRKVNEKEYFQLNVESLLSNLKSKRILCLKGIYGTGTTEHALTIADKWISSENFIIYFRPHSRLQVSSHMEEFLKILNTKDENSFLSALIELRKHKKEILLIVDDLDCMDFSEKQSLNFLNYLKNLQEDNLLNTMYVFRTNVVEKQIKNIYNNDFPLVFIGENKFVDVQTKDEKIFLKKNFDMKDPDVERFLFFFGMNYKIMNEYNDFVKSHKENNNVQKSLDDFIDAKIDKNVEMIKGKGLKNYVTRLCKTIDNDGILETKWKENLSPSEINILENNDILVISGTTSSLNRAALFKLCERNWRNWDINKWRGKWNVDYYL